MIMLSCKITRRIFHKGDLLRGIILKVRVKKKKKDDKKHKSSFSQLLPDLPYSVDPGQCVEHPGVAELGE